MPKDCDLTQAVSLLLFLPGPKISEDGQALCFTPKSNTSSHFLPETQDYYFKEAN